MNILYVTDENYAPICGVSIYSLLNNNKNMEICIYIISHLTKKTKEKFIQMIYSFGVKCIFIEMDEIEKECISKGVPKYRNSYGAYARLFLEYYLPMERVLYIDCDTLIVGKLKELSTINMNNCPVGAVVDIVNSYSNVLIGHDRCHYYYNTGVMLIDLKVWRDNKCTEKIMKMMSELDISKTATGSDQDVINKAIGDKIYKLPLKYNEMSLTRYFSIKKTYFLTDKNTEDYYSSEEIKYAKNNPVIFHFAGGGGKRPWYIGSSCLKTETSLWKYNQEMTPWKDWEQPECKDNMVKRAMRTLYLRYNPWIICYVNRFLNKRKLKRLHLK